MRADMDRPTDNNGGEKDARNILTFPIFGLAAKIFVTTFLFNPFKDYREFRKKWATKNLLFSKLGA